MGAASFQVVTRTSLLSFLNVGFYLTLIVLASSERAGTAVILSARGPLRHQPLTLCPLPISKEIQQ